MDRPARPRTAHRRGFTLVELLVVIGIIALLIGILLPTLGRAREASYKTKCLSNLHQIGLAMLMYVNDNKGTFPASARLTNEFNEDFVWWEEPRAFWNPPSVGTYGPTNTRPTLAQDPRTSAQDMDRGALVRYMGNHFNAAAWTCPTDDITSRPNTGTYGATHTSFPAYPYSYQMNNLLSCELFVTNNNMAAGYVKNHAKVTHMRHSAEVVMFLEESSTTINDGDCQIVDLNGGGVVAPWMPGGTIAFMAGGGNASLLADGVSNPAAGDWLAVRHDGTRRRPDTMFIASKDVVDGSKIPNAGASGNVVFCDGHAAFVSRGYVHSVLGRHWDPTY